MTPWYAWALFICGPFLCAGAGAWVMWLFDRRNTERALDDEFHAGWSEGWQRAQLHTGTMVPDVPTMLVGPLPGGRHADPGGCCYHCQGDAAEQWITEQFRTIRLNLGLVPNSGPDFHAWQAVTTLAPPASQTVIP